MMPIPHNVVVSAGLCHSPHPGHKAKSDSWGSYSLSQHSVMSVGSQGLERQSFMIHRSAQIQIISSILRWLLTMAPGGLLEDEVNSYSKPRLLLQIIST